MEEAGPQKAMEMMAEFQKEAEALTKEMEAKYASKEDSTAFAQAVQKAVDACTGKK